ncbi:MAG: OsmC family protein [Pseudomonadota bacterium]
MVTIRQKTTVQMKLSASAETHARTRVKVRDVEGLIDEPEARGGTNQAPSPTETLMSSLIGCTNVITQKIAHKMGVEINAMDIRVSVNFDRRGVILEEEVERPFSDLVMDIDITTDATDEQMSAIKSDLAKFCPVAKVFRGSGINVTENWNVTRP